MSMKSASAARSTSADNVVLLSEVRKQPGRAEAKRRDNAQIWRNLMKREWHGHLDTGERDLLSFLLDCTVEWGKKSLDFTWPQLRDGESGTEGHAWSRSPINISRATFYRRLRRLEQLGLVHREEKRSRAGCYTVVSLNLDGKPSNDVPSYNEKVLHLAEKRAERVLLEERRGAVRRPVREDSQSQIETTLVSKRDPFITTQSNNTPIKRTPIAPLKGSARTASEPGGQSEIDFTEQAGEDLGPVQTVEPTFDPVEAVSQVVAKVQSRPAQQAKLPRRDDKATSYAATWAAAWRETYEGISVSPIGIRESGMLSASLRRFMPGDVDGRHEFVDFCVRNWRQIVAERFGWMRKSHPPQYPQVGFLVATKMQDLFFAAYADRQKMARTYTLPAEQAELERLVHAGMTRENALLKIGERRASSAHAEEQRQVRRDNAQSTRNAQAAFDAERQRLREERRRLREEQEAKTSQRPHQASAELVENEFPELGEFKELEPLPPIDYSHWN